LSEPTRLDFLSFLRDGIARGGFETDDALAAILPLMKQVLEAHDADRVAPLDGIDDVLVTDQGFLTFAPEKAAASEKNATRVDELQTPVSRVMEVVAERRLTADVDRGALTESSLDVAPDGATFPKPVFLPAYRSWEHAIGHHDELTDIFSLGLLLASISGGLDFTDASELEEFVANRSNLFRINARLHPIVASLIVQMTELNRHKRAPDLAQLISRLENYRDLPADLDFNRIDGFAESGLTGKRRLIQSRLRDRLFDISRRNRLIYFKPTASTLNMTVASVPILLDYRNIKLEQLFVWHPKLAAAITDGGPLSLGKYLRFEDAPYVPAVLDKIMSEARRDRAEFGFAQLRLVLCFLRWNNLKDTPNERINSPLLLLPVEVTKKKGVRDNYILAPMTGEAEVNPALRYHLKELYNLSLPEVVDLRETSLEEFYDAIKAQIAASEPGVTLNKIDRPQIELIRERALQRLDQYRKRMKSSARGARNSAKPDYSYDRDGFRPLGLQLFLAKVRPSPMPLRNVAGAAPEARVPQMVDSEPSPKEGKVLAMEREMFVLEGGNNVNPYSWDFDLCSQTLANFNYRKMTLVRDYAKLIETDMASNAFDTIFSLTPKAPEEALPPSLQLTDEHLIISCDATQATAIARARTGASYIIEGPPGTGKSQTITNLIADYVARGKRVLFVCEKRAAIDVVFHRLRQQGLDELCCLIHDSQTDKKAFIQGLKQTYENALSSDLQDGDVRKERARTIREMEQGVASLRDFSEAMQQPHEKTGIPLRSLLHRLVELCGRAHERPPEIEDALPDYAAWLDHGDVVERLRAALNDLGEDPCFSKHPLRWLGKSVLEADRPLEALATRIDQANELLDAIRSAFESSDIPANDRDTIEKAGTLIEFASRAGPLAQAEKLSVLTNGAAAKTFDSLAADLAESTLALLQAQEKASPWHDPLRADDTQNALRQARAFEKSPLRVLRPAFWRLRRILRARYDFARHAVAPSMVNVLTDLSDQHRLQAVVNSFREKASRAWRTDDIEGVCKLVFDLRRGPLLAQPPVKNLIRQLAGSDEAGPLFEELASIREQFIELDETLQFLLAEFQQFKLEELPEVLGQLREQTGLLADLLPALGEIANLPDSFSHALRHVPVPLDLLEGAAGQKSVNLVYRQDRALRRFDARALARKTAQLEKHHGQWLSQNSRCIRAAVRERFREHVTISSSPASQLDAGQKAFKKTYAAGRRELEHEFGKTMRYKSIRDLAGGATGDVIQDLKPIWLMSPLSVSDTLPLEPTYFDVVIFDEASQVPLEEAIPALYRSHQVIVVGDEMQLPPTKFFTSARGEVESVFALEEGERIEVDLGSDSFLTQSATNLPKTLLAWHYRSRYESLISFSNAAFYSGNLFTIPDRQRFTNAQAELRVSDNGQDGANIEAVLTRSISFHFMENGLYENRRNQNEAAYIALLVRGLLERHTGLSIGVVAFSEAQQTEIEDALRQLAEDDSEFAAQLEAEYLREENDQFCGLFVKNLENVQGDERDIILLSVCYAKGANGRMLMNFGPINQRGGEKRLNVIFSRAKHHMVVVSSIRHDDITNDHNDGANTLKNFLRYAEATSRGEFAQSRRVLEMVNPASRKSHAPVNEGDAVVAALAKALKSRGYVVDLDVGQSRFRCDLAVAGKSLSHYQLAILVDTSAHYQNANLLDRYLMQPSILRSFGWNCELVLTKDWYQNPDDVLARLERLLEHTSAPDDQL
jgi:AAA domain/REase_MTES_1575/Protein of unknown function (DUF4011)